MSYEHEPEPWSIADTIGELRMFPSPVVWAAGAIIVAVAAFGLYQGVRGGMNGGAGAGGPEEAATGDAVSAQAAQPLVSSAQWSALSGPAMASNTAPQAASAQPSSDDQDDDTSQAADSAAPVTISAAPPQPQPISAAPAPQAQPAPAGQPPAQPQPVPGTY